MINKPYTPPGMHDYALQSLRAIPDAKLNAEANGTRRRLTRSAHRYVWNSIVCAETLRFMTPNVLHITGRTSSGPKPACAVRVHGTC
jgi:hypothetical protein